MPLRWDGREVRIHRFEGDDPVCIDSLGLECCKISRRKALANRIMPVRAILIGKIKDVNSYANILVEVYGFDRATIEKYVEGPK